MSATIIDLNNKDSFLSAVKRCADYILSGKVVAFPTESFYGLGVDATNETAVERLFAVKKRAFKNPVLVLIGSVDELPRLATDIPPVSNRLIEKFWPGGLTLVFKAARDVSPLLTAGTGKIGVRLSSHPVALALAKTAGVPITGTSANLSNEPACISAQEVNRVFGNTIIDLILDGGEAAGKAGSTVLDVTVEPPRILREGMITASEIEKFEAGQI
jgi:L-threonylcarbamoyladenylate synthase